MWFMVKDQLGQLAQVAANKPEAKLIAEQVLASIPEAYDSQLYTLLNSPTWFEGMVAVQPALAAHREWMTALRGELLKAFTDEASAPDTGGK